MSRRGAVGGVVFVLAAIALVAAVLVLTRTGSDGEAELTADGATTSALPAQTPSVPPGPTLGEQRVAWAGDVCTARDRLRSRVTSLGSDLDVSIGPGMLEDLDRQVRLQLLAVGSAANDLVEVVTVAPVEPVELNDWVVTIEGPQQRLQAAVEETRGNLDAMTGAPSVLDSVGAAGSVITSGAEAVQAGQELLDALQQVYADAESRFAPAFAAAPECAPSS